MRQKSYQIIEVSRNRVMLQVLTDNCWLANWMHAVGAEVSYWAPSSGGYVRRVTDRRPGTLGQQVCDGLATMGSTLYWDGRRPLVEMIRREARDAQREHMREFCRF